MQERTEVYVKDSAGWGCLKGLMALDEVIAAPGVDYLLELDLMPTPDALLALDTIYGISRAQSARYFRQLEVNEVEVAEAAPPKTKLARKDALDANNADFITMLRCRAKSRPADAIRRNIEEVGRTVKLDRPEMFVSGNPEHIYSQQTFNSTTTARADLQAHFRSQNEALVRTHRGGGHRMPSLVLTYNEGKGHHAGAGFALIDPEIQRKEHAMHSMTRHVGGHFENTHRLSVDIKQSGLKATPDEEVPHHHEQLQGVENRFRGIVGTMISSRCRRVWGPLRI